MFKYSGIILSIILSSFSEISKPVEIILDTDIGPDCDDAGAIAVLNVLADKGEAKILGMMCCTSSPWGAPCVDAINTYYGRPDIPIGTYKQKGFLGKSKYDIHIAKEFPNSLGSGEKAPDAKDLYREILSEQTDKSVVICAIGPLNNLSDLLKTDSDEYSPLNGVELVRAKVKLLVVMGGVFPEGLSWNFQQDGPAAKNVTDEWPSPVIFSGREIGLVVNTGNRLYTEAPESNPVRRAYELWTGGTNRPSWDQTAVLCAVRGTSNYWTASDRGRCVTGSDGYNKWYDDANGKHIYLLQKMPVPQLAEEIEDMMLQSPCK